MTGRAGTIVLIMPEPPTWFPYVTLGVSLAALVVAAASYFRAGPRVKVNTSTTKGWKLGSSEELLLTVTCRHTGLAPLEISGMSLTLVVMGVPYGPAVLKNSYLYDGVALPAPLKEGGKKVWTFSLHELASDQNLESVELPRGIRDFRAKLPAFLSAALVPYSYLLHPVSVVLLVELGSGRMVEERVPALSRIALHRMWRLWRQRMAQNDDS